MVMEKYRMGDKKKDDYKDALNIHGNYRVPQKEALVFFFHLTHFITKDFFVYLKVS